MGVFHKCSWSSVCRPDSPNRRLQRTQEKGRGRRETSMSERNRDWLPPAQPPPGMEPATGACALTGNRTRNPWVHRMTPSQLSNTGQG